MSTDELTSLLRRSATGHRARTADCPEELQIAAYVDGGLEVADCERLELHLANCDACLSLVGLLSRHRDAGVWAPVPELAVARARSLVKSGRSRWSLNAPRWAAAAMALVTVAAVVQLAQYTGPAGEFSTPPGERVTRNIPTASAGPQVLYPSPGMIVDARQLVFRWESVPGSRYYQVRIVSDSGDLIDEHRVAGTEWRPTGELELHPGAEYFVQVDAYTSDAKPIGSEHVPFGVSDGS